MHSFVYGILGGLLIGISAAILLVFSGDMLGACGIVSSISLAPKAAMQKAEQQWKLVLLASFCLTSNLFFASEYQDEGDALARLSPWAFFLGGLLVGFGTKLGNGCTSGHGICGLARFSTRSLASVCTFMCVGIVTAYLTQASTTPFPKDIFAFLRNDEATELTMWPKTASVVVMFMALAALMAPSFHDLSLSNSRKKLAPAAISGALFAVGLYVSRMVFPKYVFGFLNLGLLARGGDNWDPTLMFVMGGGVLVSVVSYQFIDGYSLVLPRDKTLSKPILLSDGAKFNIPSNHTIDKELILGAILFGLGWGITGLCPGPAIFLASIGVAWILVCYWPAFLIGTFVASLLQQRLGFSAAAARECGSSGHCSMALATTEREETERSSSRDKLQPTRAASPPSPPILQEDVA